MRRSLRADHALDRPMAEAFRGLRYLLLGRIGHEGRDGGPGTRYEGAQAADDGPAQHREEGLLQVGLGGPHVAQPHLGIFGVGLDDLVDAVHEFGDAEQAERERDELDAVVELGQPEGEPLRAGLDVGSDDAEHQPEHRHGDALDGRAARQRRAGEQAQQHERADFGRTELQCRPHQQGRQEHHLGDAPGRAHEGRHHRDAQCHPAAALGVTVMASFVGASWGITEMVFLSPLLVRAALQFGPAEICSLMLLGLLAGSTLARGFPIKGVAMTVLGLMLGIVGSDIETASERGTVWLAPLDDGIELIALALGLFGIAEFMNSINQIVETNTKYSKVRLRDMRPSKADLKQSFFPMLRGTIIGSLCALIPGTRPTIASFVSYAAEEKISKTPERFGHGAIEGVVCPEASTHSSIQGDFIPTMSMGIPGDAVMALLLGALMIQGIAPGPQLITEHPDIFWGLIASFWVGNILLVVLNVPMIGLWVKLLAVPYRYLYPSALFFVCIGVYAANNDMFQVGEVILIGILGYTLLRLGFQPAPILLGFVLGPRFEENFRRAMLISRGDLITFLEKPISALFLAFCVILIRA